MKLKEIEVTEEELYLLSAFEEWFKRIDEGGEWKKKADRNKQLARAYYEAVGIEIGERSPIVMMFTCFMGGMDMAVDILDKIEKL